jgi:hypothetical protein
MKQAEVKEKQSKKEIFELIEILDDKLMNVDAEGKKNHLFLNIGNFPPVLLFV